MHRVDREPEELCHFVVAERPGDRAPSRCRTGGLLVPGVRAVAQHRDGGLTQRLLGARLEQPQRRGGDQRVEVDAARVGAHLGGECGLPDAESGGELGAPPVVSVLPAPPALGWRGVCSDGFVMAMALL